MGSGSGLLPLRLSNLELHRDFDHHVDGGATTMRGRKAPLADRLHGALVEAIAEALQHAHVADAAVAPHHDLHHDVAFDSALPRLLRVIRLHLAQERRRLDAAARPVRSAAGAAALAFTDTAALAFAEAGTFAGAGATAGSGPPALVLRRGLLQHARVRAFVRRGRRDRRFNRRERFRLDLRWLGILRRLDRLRLLWWPPHRQGSVNRVFARALRLRGGETL